MSAIITGPVRFHSVTYFPFVRSPTVFRERARADVYLNVNVYVYTYIYVHSVLDQHCNTHMSICVLKMSV